MSSAKFKSVTGPFNWINNQRVSPEDVTASGVIKNIEPRSGKVLAEVPTCLSSFLTLAPDLLLKPSEKNEEGNILPAS